MSDAARDWLGKGELWRHPATGHVAGVARAERDGLLEWISHALWGVCGTAITYAAENRLRPALAGIRWYGVHMEIGAGLMIGMALTAACIGTYGAVLRSGLIPRCLLAAAAMLLPLALRSSEWTSLTVTASCCLALAAGSRDPRLATARMEARGYRRVIARSGTGSTPPSPRPQPSRRSPPVRPPEIRVDKYVHHAVQFERHKTDRNRYFGFAAVSVTFSTIIILVAANRPHPLEVLLYPANFIAFVPAVIFSAKLLRELSDWYGWTPTMRPEELADSNAVISAAGTLLSGFREDDPDQPSRTSLIRMLSTPQAIRLLRGGKHTPVLHRLRSPAGSESLTLLWCPHPTPAYPYGWVFDASLPGYVPRRADLFESPIPRTAAVPEPGIASRNKPRPGDDIGRITTVRHRYAKPDGTIVETDFPKPGPSRKYPFGWVFDPTVPGYVPRQGDPYESPAPQPMPPKPPSDAYGRNRPRTGEQMRQDGAAHPWPKG